MGTEQGRVVISDQGPRKAALGAESASSRRSLGKHIPGRGERQGAKAGEES